LQKDEEEADFEADTADAAMEDVRVPLPRVNPINLLTRLSTQGKVQLGELSFKARPNYHKRRLWMGVNVGVLYPERGERGGVDPAPYYAKELWHEWHITLFYSPLDNRCFEETDKLARIIVKAEEVGNRMVESWTRDGTHLEIDTIAAPHIMSHGHYAWSDIAPFEEGRSTRVTELLHTLAGKVLDDVPMTIKKWQKKDSYHLSAARIEFDDADPVFPCDDATKPRLRPSRG